MKLVNGDIQVAGDQWPIFLYANYTYDPEDPWNGLLQGGLLVSVSDFWFSDRRLVHHYSQAFKHIFTSPSSVDQEPKATRSGNARIHGMRAVTKASLAYVATQVGNIICNEATFYRKISRHDLLWHPHRSSRVQIWWPIPSVFTRASWNYWRTLMRRMRSTSCLLGGIGRQNFEPFHWFLLTVLDRYSPFTLRVNGCPRKIVL